MHNRDNWGDFSDFRGWHGGHRARRGDMKHIILKVLLAKPMHGYEIISQIEEESHGMWRPSAGSVYPTLQLLEDQDLVTFEELKGKKVYSLTEQGKIEADKASDFKKHWEEKMKGARGFRDLKQVFHDSMLSVKRISAQNDEEKNAEVKQIFIETRDKLANLAERDIIK